MEKEIKITPPDGYEIDKENSTFDCIKFKPITKRWRDDESQTLQGYYITGYSCITINTDPYTNAPHNYNVFATEKQAKSALAMARISQIMANDKRFGGVVTDEEWANETTTKHVIARYKEVIFQTTYTSTYSFLAFHTEEQRDLFLKENEDLVRDYLMLND